MLIEGNELIIITNFNDDDNPQEDKSYTLCDNKKLSQIADDGGQPFLNILSKNFKILTANEEYNEYQLQFLSNFLHRALYKSIIPEEFIEYNNKYKKLIKKKVDSTKDIKFLESYIKIHYQDDKEFVEKLGQGIKMIYDRIKDKFKKSDEVCNLL